MATVNKTDRKKLVSTEVLRGRELVFFDTRTNGEFARLNVAILSDDVQAQLMVYGAKQIVSDVVAGLDGADAKVEGMAAAVDALRGGAWPRRKPAEGSLDRAIDLLMMTQGIDRDAARALLGL